VEDVSRVMVVRSPIAGDRACEALRAQGIKCACIEMPSERARTSPFRYISAASDPGVELTVIVASADEARARDVLREWAKSPDHQPESDP
jgi:hypothetical protein